MLREDEMEFDNAVREAIVAEIGHERFELWFGDGVQFLIEKDRLKVEADSLFRLERLRKAFLRHIRQALAAMDQHGMEVAFAVRDQPTSTEASQADTRAKPCPSPQDANDEVAGHRPRIRAASYQRRGRRFRSLNDFITGDCNRLARTSAEMVIKQPGEVSPLFIHGPTGVGKTHLVEGIWGYAKQRDRRSRVVYLSAEQFTTYFVEALKGSGLPNFRRKYRQADVLIIDDIQFFGGKQATLVELTYTIDELNREGRQREKGGPVVCLTLCARQKLRQKVSLIM